MVPRTSVPLRVTAPSAMVMSKTVVIVAVMVTVSRAGVLKISTGVKRLAVAL
jgi:hypothetical protein